MLVCFTLVFGVGWPGAIAFGQAGRALRLPVTRDTWLSNYGQEIDGNNGGSPKLKLKSYQEMSLVDIDPAPLAGRVVRRATLHLRSTGEPRLRRVTVGTFGAEWVEGTATGYAHQPGSSTFNHRRFPDLPWTIAGSDLCGVILGQGGTTWRMAESSPPDNHGWQQVTVDPLIIAARVAGISQGFLVFDDTGSEWTRDGERFSQNHFPNRFVHSRESGAASAPYFTIELGAEDREPPQSPGPLQSETADLPAGEAWVSWTTPADGGPAGTIGFIVRVDGKELPRYLVPLAGPVGERVRMLLRDLGLQPGVEIGVEVLATDAAGNRGPAAKAKIHVSERRAAPLPQAIAPQPQHPIAPRPRLAGMEVAVIDELDKIQPLTGEMIPRQPDGYLDANHLWSSATRSIELHAARNEFIGFQVYFKGNAQTVVPALRFEGANAATIQAEFGWYQPVETKKGPLPDPIVPLKTKQVPTGSVTSLYGEIFVPRDAGPGKHRGKLVLRSGGETLEIDVSLEVWNFTLPDFLSFLPDMNCYGLPTNDRDYYRLAHRHRTVLNRVPYHQNGQMAEGMAPAWDGKRLDWTAWDARFGPYFDGSAFADLPRKKVPIECFYLPLHENWPMPIEPNYNGSYWADEAFTARYRRDFVEVSRQFAEHINGKTWNDTLFQCFFNGKNDFKRQGWSRGSSPWLLDEPANFQDFWALRYFGVAFHEGVNLAPGPAKLVFRCDISRPQWQRDALDGLLDYNVVGSAIRSYHRIVLDRKAAERQLVVEYGSSNAVEESNVQPVGWSIDSWALGSDGVLPWQTIGRAESWNKADPLALFYPGRSGGETGPIPSIRLKAYRRGQQDVEYLTLLSLVKNEPRWAVGQRVREALHLAPERHGTDAAGEDAGVIHYRRLLPQDLSMLRQRIGRALSEAHPAPRRKLIELRTPPRSLKGMNPALAR